MEDRGPSPATKRDGIAGQHVLEPALELPAQTAPFVELYRVMLTARFIDEAEADLVKRGEAFFHLSGAGHEGSAVLNLHLQATDWLHCHYRDRALMVGRGVTPEAFFQSLLCTANSHSAGRQMGAMMSDPERRIMSVVTPVGNSALQAVGVAAEVKNDATEPIVLCSIGDGGTQQGEVLESIAEAIRCKLPVLFWIEDNGLAISTSTRGKTFYDLPTGRAAEYCGLPIHYLNGRDVLECDQRLPEIIRSVRESRSPGIVVVDVDRLHSHTSADDQRVYRTAEEIKRAREFSDPIRNLGDQLILCGHTVEELEEIAETTRQKVGRQAMIARRTADPPYGQEAKAKLPERLTSIREEYTGGDPSRELSMLEAIREVLRQRLNRDARVTLFGQDIEDPKGDVFGLTRGLSTQFPEQVQNSALSESIIVGTAVGRAMAGGRPVAFIQFADFLPLAFNQMVSELGSMYWRTCGAWQCPVIIMAPCGGYRPGLGPFHASTYESVALQIPGLDLFMPSSAGDAAGLLNAAFESNRPTLFLYPKICLNDRDRATTADVDKQLVAIGKARSLSEGDDLTIVTWGSTVTHCEKVVAALRTAGASAELIDLRSLSPWDRDAVCRSTRKTRKLLVVHEDTLTCGMGSEVVATVAERLGGNVAARRITRPDTYVPCNFSSQLDTLPSFRSILSAAAEMLELDLRWEAPLASSEESIVIEAQGSSPADQEITVVQWVIEPGDTVRAGDLLAELEAEKAAYEFTSPISGQIEALLVGESDAVPVGTPLLRIRAQAQAAVQKRVTREEPGTPHLQARAPKAAAMRQATDAVATQTWFSSISAAEGSERITNEDLLQYFPDRSAEDIVQRTGILSRPRATTGENAITLATRASRAALQRDRLTIDDVDAIICSTTTPVDISPSLACRTLHELCGGRGPREIPAYDIFAACSGYLYALSSAQAFLHAHPEQTVLVVTAEVLSPVLDQKDFDTSILFGDAATATLLTNRSQTEGKRFVLHRPALSGSGEDGSVLRVPLAGNGFVEMNGRRVFSQAVRKMIDILRRACEDSEVEVEDLALIVPHQANARIIEAIRDRLAIEPDRIVNRIAHHGNTLSSSIPLALAEILEHQRVGDKLGLCAFGAGYTYAGALLEVCDS
ncbi:MAG: beta-ketoacyl-ACP synthase 3 [Pirellulales bacterium]